MKSKAQSISEYVILLSVITLALMAMQLYFRRGIQAVIRLAADDMGNQKDAVDVEYRSGRWLWRYDPVVSEVTTNGSANTTLGQQGQVQYETEEKSQTSYQDGILARGWWLQGE